jgi:hypothetical protein
MIAGTSPFKELAECDKMKDDEPMVNTDLGKNVEG